jgi:hypothetical protein
VINDDDGIDRSVHQRVKKPPSSDHRLRHGCRPAAPSPSRLVESASDHQLAMVPEDSASTDQRVLRSGEAVDAQSHPSG